MVHNNLTAHLTLFLLVISSAVVPTIIVGILTLRISEEAIRKETEVKLSVANTTAKKQLEDWIEEHTEAVEFLSEGIPEMKRITNAVVNETDSNLKLQDKDLLGQYLKQFSNIHKSFIQVFLLHPTSGEVLASTDPKQEGKLYPDSPYFIEGKMRPFVQNVYYSLSTEQMTVTISAPIRSSDGSLLGVIAGNLNLNQLNQVLRQPAGLGKTVKSYAVNTFKLIVAGLPDETLEENDYRYYQLNTPPVVEGLKGKSGVASYKTFNEKQVVGSYLSIPELELLVITEIDEDEMLNPIRSLEFVATTTTIVTLGVTILVAIYLVRLFLASTDSYRRKLETTNKQLEQTQKDLEIHNVQLGMLSRSLETEKEQMERLLHSLSNGVLAVDEQQVVWLCNAAAERILGMDRNQLIGVKIDEVFRVYKERDVVIFTEYCRQQSLVVHWFGKNTNSTNSEMDKLLSLATAPVLVGTSRQSGWVVTFHDVTREAQLEAMKLDFVAMSAHELRTPLTTVRGYLSLFLDNQETVKKLTDAERDMLNRVSLNAQRLGKLIENLLVVSRIEKGQIKLELQPAQLEEILGRVVQELKSQAEMKKLQLEFRRNNQPLPLVLVDKVRIEEVMSNLIGNAINYTNIGGVIVSIIQRENELVVSVRDTGEGIPKEAIEHLFTKFFRVQTSLVAGSKGTGLGLYISKGIIEAHKGKVWLESEVGKGSTFYFSLPISNITPHISS